MPVAGGGSGFAARCRGQDGPAPRLGRSAEDPDRITTNLTNITNGNRAALFDPDGAGGQRPRSSKRRSKITITKMIKSKRKIKRMIRWRTCCALGREFELKRDEERRSVGGQESTRWPGSIHTEIFVPFATAVFPNLRIILVSCALTFGRTGADRTRDARMRDGACARLRLKISERPRAGFVPLKVLGLLRKNRA
jgi:hypothetical protein